MQEVSGVFLFMMKPATKKQIEDFEAAYLRTTYIIVTNDKQIRLRVGEANAELDELLASHNADEWAFITAYNPRSQILSPDENQKRQREFVARLVEAGYETIDGRGVGSDESWQPEASVLVLNITRPAAQKFAREYEQNAIVVGRRESAPELVWC